MIENHTQKILTKMISSIDGNIRLVGRIKNGRFYTAFASNHLSFMGVKYNKLIRLNKTVFRNSGTRPTELRQHPDDSGIVNGGTLTSWRKLISSSRTN